MAYSNDKLENYIKRLTELQQSNQKSILSKKEMDDIALSIGFSPSDIEEYDKHFHDYLSRGTNFLKYDNYEDAVNQLEEAVTLNPVSLEAHINLALAYEQWYNKEYNARYASQAIYLAEKASLIDPDCEPAIQIISRVKASLKRSKPPVSSTKKNSFYWVAGVIITIFISSMIITFINDFNTSFKEPAEEENYSESIQKNWNEENVTSTEVDVEIKESVSEKVIVTEEYREDFIDSKLPITIVKNKYSNNLNFEIKESDYIDYTNAHSIKISGYIKPENSTVKKLLLWCKIYDYKGEVIFNETGYALSEGGDETEVRKGEVIPFMFINYQGKPGTINDYGKIELGVKNITTIPHIENRKTEPEVDLIWDVKQPEGMDIKIRERFSNWDWNSFSKEVIHKSVITVKNTGQLPINQIQANFVWYDPKGNEISSSDAYLYTSGDPPLPINETSVYGRYFGLENTSAKTKIDRYAIKITNIE